MQIYRTMSFLLRSEVKSTLLGISLAIAMLFLTPSPSWAQRESSPRYPSRGLQRISWHTAAESPVLTPDINNGHVVYAAQTSERPTDWDIFEPYTATNEIFYYGHPTLTGPYIFPTAHQITTNAYRDGPERDEYGGDSPVVASNGAAAWDTPYGVRVFWGLGTDWPRDSLLDVGPPHRESIMPPVISGDHALWVENFSDGTSQWQTPVVHQLSTGNTFEPSIALTPGLEYRQVSLSGDHVFEVIGQQSSGTVLASDIYRWNITDTTPNPARISPPDSPSSGSIVAEWGLASWQDQAAWIASDGTESSEIWMYAGGAATQITDNAWPEHDVGIADGRLVWRQLGGYDATTGAPIYGVQYFDGTDIHNFGRGSYPVISDEGVAWVTEGGGISYYDIVHDRTQLIVEDGANARNLAIDGSSIAFYADNAMQESHQARVVDGQIELETFEKEVYVSSYLGGAFSMAYSSVAGSPLAGVDLGDLDLSHVIFAGNDLTGTDFSGSDLSFATGLETTTGAAIYSHLTVLPANFNPGDLSTPWHYVTPEPAGIFLALWGLLFWPRRTRRHP
ncbi:MAG: pentapeptide repeat-containing protein [Planctomycetota bacterium]|nr:pentapeptide repeat-containing protein [Planctomycetota bacterium]